MRALTLLILLLMPLAAVKASTCAEEAELLARQYGLSGAGTKPGPEERTTKPDQEAPPSPEARRPAEGAGSTDSHHAPAASGSSETPPLTPERRARMDAALTAARGTGDEAQCFRLLEEARSALPGTGQAR
jgi:hypothetical protein